MSDKQISIRVPMTIYKALEKAALNKDLTISQLIRSLIRMFLGK